MNIQITALNGGYASPLIQSRNDLDKAESMCRMINNMLPLIYGPVTKRPGTQYIYASVAPVDTPTPFSYP